MRKRRIDTFTPRSLHAPNAVVVAVISTGQPQAGAAYRRFNAIMWMTTMNPFHGAEIQ
jgi:hypothetical protein